MYLFLVIGSFTSTFAIIAALVISRPLTDLLCKNTRFEWTEERDVAFKLLKEALTSRPILAMYEPNAYTELHTDASQHGVAAVLMQRQAEDGKMDPISYFSRKMTKDVSKFHSYELEALFVS